MSNEIKMANPARAQKVFIILLLALVLSMPALAGCGDTASASGISSGSGEAYIGDDDDIFVIGERFFVARFFDILFDTDRYVGRTIQYEGMFFTMELPEETIHIVARHTDGCCGPSLIGLEVILGDIPSLPDDAWVEVTGVLEYHEEGFLVIRAISVIELDVRGAEFVQ